MGYPLRFAIPFMLLALWSANAASAENANFVATTWLDRLNFYRATAALPPVVEEPALSGPVTQHARYMVANDVVQHSQNSRRSWWTPEGAVAATVSNLAGSRNPNEPDWWAVDVWMQAPFHALGILDPALLRVGFGIHRQHDGRKIQTAAGLDVIRGRGSKPAHVTYPIVWPADGTSVPIGIHTSEYPSPLSSCPGYKAPTGLPLILQLGAGEEIPRVTRTTISVVRSSLDIALDDPELVEGSLEHCSFDESTYRNRHDVEQALGRSILASRDAVVLIPRKPLQAGSSYRVHVEASGRTIDWTFTVSP